MPTDQERRAVIYARRSTAEQDESIGRQVAECEQALTAQGFALIHVYSDTASGWRPQTPRPQFDAMIRDAARGHFAHVFVWEVSRLSRQADDQSALSIIWKLRGHGVEVHSITEQSTGVGLADDLTLLIKSHAAKEESDSKSRRVASGKRLGVTKGVHQGRWAPYGTRRQGQVIVGTRAVARYEVDPGAAAVLREILRLYIGGESPQGIAHTLNLRAVPPPRPGQPHRLQRRMSPEWHQSTVRDLITNPLLAGFASYKGRRLKSCTCASLDAPDGWDDCPHEWVASVNVPAAVEASLWDQAQQVRASRSRRVFGGRRSGSSDRFLLMGLAWCGSCGERLGCRADQAGGDKHRYLCRGRRLGTCSLPPLLQSEVDAAVRDSFVRCFVDAVDVQATIQRERDRLMAVRQSEAALLAEEIAAVATELREAKVAADRLSADYLARRLSADQFARLDEQVSAQRASAQQRMHHLESRREAVGTAADIGEVDALIDRCSSIQRILSGRLTGEDVPTLNAQLCDVFEEFRIVQDGARVIIEPRLRREWLPQGEWTILDFADEESRQTPGLEVVEYLDPVLRRVDLAASVGLTTPTDSS